MNGAPFDTRRLIRDLPDLLAGKEPVLGSPAATSSLRSDPVARQMFVAAMEMGSALEGGVAAVRWRHRAIPGELRRPIERAHRFFRRRIAEVGLQVGFTRFVEQRDATSGYFENADAALPVRGDERETLERARSALTREGLDDLERETLDAIDTDDPRKIFPICRELDPACSVARYYALLVDRERSNDPQEWLDLAESAQEPETVGWALVYAGSGFHANDEPRQAIDTSERASQFLPGCVAPVFNRLLFAIWAQDTSAAAESTHSASLHTVDHEAISQHTRYRKRALSRATDSSKKLASQLASTLPQRLGEALREAFQ